MTQARGPGAAPSRARALVVLALLSAVVAAAFYGRPAWVDSGRFAFVLFGIPAGCAVAALWVERASRTVLAPVLVAALATVVIGWSLLTAGGIGLVFLPTAFFLLLAAWAAWATPTDRDRRPPADPRTRVE